MAFLEKRTVMVEWQNDLTDTLGCRDANIVAARLAVTFALAEEPIDVRRAAAWLDRYIPADAADRRQFMDEVMVVLEELTHEYRTTSWPGASLKYPDPFQADHFHSASSVVASAASIREKSA
jgi:hypothetical protein